MKFHEKLKTQFFKVNPFPTKKGQICRNWVDSRGLIFSKFHEKLKTQLFKVNPYPTKKGEICRNWVDSRGLIFQNFMRNSRPNFSQSTHFLQKRVNFVGNGWTKASLIFAYYLSHCFNIFNNLNLSNSYSHKFLVFFPNFRMASLQKVSG